MITTSDDISSSNGYVSIGEGAVAAHTELGSEDLSINAYRPFLHYTLCK
jgi:hypothetical protein